MGPSKWNPTHATRETIRNFRLFKDELTRHWVHHPSGYRIDACISPIALSPLRNFLDRITRKYVVIIYVWQYHNNNSSSRGIWKKNIYTTYYLLNVDQSPVFFFFFYLPKRVKKIYNLCNVADTLLLCFFFFKSDLEIYYDIISTYNTTNMYVTVS